MAHPQAFAMVLAGGEGKRLAPLTADRAKPAVLFARAAPEALSGQAGTDGTAGRRDPRMSG